MCELGRYESILAELRRTGGLELDTRRELAAEAFSHTAAYEAAIASWFSDRESFPGRLLVALEKQADLPYGENPHQRAGYYVEAGARRHLLSRVEQLSGGELSFNNLNDLNAARSTLREFTVPAAVIVKHANPCGCALASGIEQAYELALAADPVSAYGGVVALNRRVEKPLARRLATQFVEVLIAPGYSEGALEALRAKASLRILEDGERRGSTPGERDYRRVLGGMLVQDADAELDDRDGMKVVTVHAPSGPGGAT